MKEILLGIREQSRLLIRKLSLIAGASIEWEIVSWVSGPYSTVHLEEIIRMYTVHRFLL